MLRFSTIKPRGGAVLLPSLAGALAVLLLIASASAVDAQRLMRRGHTWTATSGLEGDVSDIVLRPEEESDGKTFGRAFIGLHLRWSNETPSAACALSIFYRRIGLHDVTGLRRSAFWLREGAWGFTSPSGILVGACRGAANHSHFDRLERAEAKARSNDHYVRGINVCMDTGDSANRSVQGVRLFLGRHTRGDNFEPVGNPEVVTRPSCRNWQTRQNCPRGAIATGLRVHTTNGRIRGLALRCTPVDDGAE